MPPVPYLHDSRAIVNCPINIWLAQRKGLQLLCSFPTTFLCRIWTDLARELKLEFERFVFLFLAFVCRAFCFCLKLA